MYLLQYFFFWYQSLVVVKKIKWGLLRFNLVERGKCTNWSQWGWFIKGAALGFCLANKRVCAWRRDLTCLWKLWRWLPSSHKALARVFFFILHCHRQYWMKRPLGNVWVLVHCSFRILPFPPLIAFVWLSKRIVDVYYWGFRLWCTSVHVYKAFSWSKWPGQDLVSEHAFQSRLTSLSPGMILRNRENLSTYI